METPQSKETVRQERIQIEIPQEAVKPSYAKEVVEGRAAVIHQNCKIENLIPYTEKMKPAPYRSAGRIMLLSLTQFTDYVKYAGGHPPVFVDNNKAEAVFNFRAEGTKRGWGDDTATFYLERTPEWKIWTRSSGGRMSQSEFCDFLEDNMQDIVEPNGSDLLGIVSNFRTLTKVEYGSAYRTQDGQVQLEYKEEKTNTSREMQLPAELLLQLPVIRGAEEITTYQIKARLKYRVDKESHKLFFTYTLIRPDIPESNAVHDVASHLREQMKDLADVFEGTVKETPMELLPLGR